MRIRSKFNIALLGVFSVGFLASALVSYQLLLKNANEEVVRNARLLMEAALSVRAYTVDDIRPKLNPLMETEFLPQTVPAFAATEVFERLRKKPEYAEFSYREAVLNPTNPRDRAAPWEAEIINKFRRGESTEIVNTRNNEKGTEVLYIASPIKITNPNCLVCHSTPQAAPASMRAKYGDANGFGWDLDEIVGSQIITVPVGLPVRNAQNAFWLFSGVLVALFVILFIVLNVMLDRLVVAPIVKVSKTSDEISKGNLELPEFKEEGAEEIKQLHASFNRMRRSIEKAMRVLHLQKEVIRQTTGGQNRSGE